MDQNKRPSVYLEERCESLLRVFDFFLAPHQGQSSGLDERLIVFLTQIDFWEWELDNLIYSFTTFDDRAKAWEHENGYGVANALKSAGILIRLSVVKDFQPRRQARSQRARKVIAPINRLNEAIRSWNQLLTACEERVLVSLEDRKEAVALGAQVLPNLSRFQKPLPLQPLGGTATPRT